MTYDPETPVPWFRECRDYIEWWMRSVNLEMGDPCHRHLHLFCILWMDLWWGWGMHPRELMAMGKLSEGKSVYHISILDRRAVL